MLAGHVSEGGVAPSTVTEKLQVELLAGVAWSLAVHVTGGVPIGKVLPEAGLHSTVGLGSHVSVAVGAEKLTTAPPAPVHWTSVMLAGQVIVGGVVSTTVTLKPQVKLLDGVAWSLAVQ